MLQFSSGNTYMDRIMTNSKLSPQVENTLTIINTKDLTQKELSNLFHNAMEYKKITEEEREVIVEALEKKIKIKHPKEAKKLFGPKDAEARSLLQKIYDETTAEYDLSANRVKGGVKTGGDMIAGRSYINVYISFKNDQKWHAVLAFNQITVDSNPRIDVALYQSGKNNDEGESHKFGVDEAEAAKTAYKAYLSKLCDAKA